jgi:hypothetical protein
MRLEVQKRLVSSNAGSCQQPFTGKIGERVMGKYKENPKYNVLSIRITDDELKALARESHTTNRSISDIMREALHSIAPQSARCINNYKTGENRL